MKENQSNLPSPQTIEQVLIKGDLNQLNEEQRLSYYKQVCESVGLNPLTRPFDFLVLNNKLTLYAKRDATDQLRKLQQISIKVVDRKKIDEVYVVTAQASTPTGRTDESTGAVTVGHLKGDALANAFMKAETKAKRRVTLSICGLGLLDESEAVDIVHEKTVVPSSSSPFPGALTQSADPGEYVLDFTKGFKGMKIKEIDTYELEKILDWAKKNSAKAEFQLAATLWLESKNLIPPKEHWDTFDKQELPEATQ